MAKSNVNIVRCAFWSQEYHITRISLVTYGEPRIGILALICSHDSTLLLLQRKNNFIH